MGPTSGLRIDINGAGLDDEELAALSRNLRGLLLELDVDSVRQVSAGAAPPGAKAGEAVTYGALLVAAAPAVVASIIEVVGSWLRRQPRDIEIEVAGQRLKGTVTRAQRDAIVAAYLQQVAATVPVVE
ncbi:hypothetical protein [Catenuloplanes atrovinosus]|uniref:Uncharacterized protein n=1 Tax=Catenuloplanes atrovinosus TaxID=137266 RepID=A0AAE3YRF0_9ACTN|nr:hypothetical protein [Catenuloplanes atrovinosus]MDR7277276.1 hypothetical protein [Catenuloplanes atrovinosus]